MRQEWQNLFLTLAFDNRVGLINSIITIVKLFYVYPDQTPITRQYCINTRLAITINIVSILTFNVATIFSV